MDNIAENVYSFDIYDTLITRKVAEPIAIFGLVQKKIQNLDLSNFIIDNFIKIRQETEYYCQERNVFLNNRYDCTIDEIYELIQNNYLLSVEDIEKIKQIEIQEEIDNVLPIIENINRVKKIIAEGEKVILISDMYFGADILRKILVNIDEIFNNIEIFSSADTGKRKSNGSQYRYISKKYKIVEHTGDNKFSDIIQAKWNNIKPVQFRLNPLKSYEKKLLNKFQYNIYSQKSIGISRFLRQNNNKQSKIFNFAVSYAAPILFSYVDWLLKEALKRHLKCLYFVARDGYVPKIIADIIIKQRNYDIKTRYFYSSRRSCRIADDSTVEQYIEQIFSELVKFQTEDFMANRFEIDKKDFIHFGGLNKEKLINNSEFKNLIIEKHKVKKELLIKYIKQEIDFNESFGFVDLNGSGRTQDNLVRLINENIRECKITSFYFNLQQDMQYFSNSLKSAYINSINLNSLILEMLCRTTHGQTLFYEEVNEKIIPVLEFENNPNIEKWGFDAYTEGLQAYTQMFADENINNDITLCTEYLNYLKGLIDKETADAIGSIPFSLWGDEKNIKEYIPAYNLFNIFKRHKFPNIAASRRCTMMKYLYYLISKITDKKTYGFISKKHELAYIKIYHFHIDVSNFFTKK